MSRSLYTQLHSFFGPTLTGSERLARIEENLRLEHSRWQPPLFPIECAWLKNTSVAIVGGGFAGLAAARWLTKHSLARVSLFEAHKEVGGRVRSDTTFSAGRIARGGAELIGSFHLMWRELALGYGLTWIGRMDKDLYAKAGLELKLRLDKPLSMAEIEKLEKDLRDKILKPIAKLARQIKYPSRPWDQKGLEKFDKMSVADALGVLKIRKNGRLWKAMEMLVLNNYVAPLHELNFLGLLCLVKGGPFTPKDTDLMGYWDELEIFRCADGNQKLATKMAAEIRGHGQRPHQAA